tara:strand:- start:253 stop:435 length:183 start_codon:yes stop_codon:yes gene_type:complete
MKNKIYSTFIFKPKGKPKTCWFTVDTKSLAQSVTLKHLLKTHPDWPPYSYKEIHFNDPTS